MTQRRAFFLALAGGLLASACAPGPKPGGVAPADVSSLETEHQRHPNDAGLMLRLGVAYYDAKNYDRARDVLQSLLALDAKSYSGRVYLGLTQEASGDLAGARASYTAAAGVTTSEKQKDEIANRLALLTRLELRAAAKQAIVRETEISREPPVENSVAVFPFRYLGTNEDYRPLERGMTHLVITDLSRVNRLKLLERERVQALVDEMQLNEGGRVDAKTGARSGRMLRAADVVQGSVQDLPANGAMKLDANVVNASTADVVASGSGSDKLQQLFDVEKRVVFQLLQRMGITLSPAEQRAISERPTADLQAFLAFSRGLEAEDRGDFRTAEGYFNAALQRDPNFRAAGEHRDANTQLSSASQTSAPILAGLGEAGLGAPASPPASGGGNRGVAGLGVTLHNIANGVVPSVGTTLSTQLGGPTPPPGVPAPLQQAQGTEDPRTGGLTGNIIIIITRP